MARLKADARKRLPIARATSAGGIVIRRNERAAEVVLGKRRRERDGATWTLPKGTPSKGETTEETALREVEEETGLQVHILEPVGSIEYWFVQRGTRIHKTVHYFLMEATGGDLGHHDHEFDDVRWVPVLEAETLMSFESERDIVQRALPLAGVA